VALQALDLVIEKMNSMMIETRLTLTRPEEKPAQMNAGK
jgi:hypothetical protein